MVNSSHKKSHRGIGVLISCVFLCVVGIILALSITTSRIPRGRLGIVLKGNPTILVSWESDRSRFALFLLPETMQIEASGGYGWYGLDALWKLDDMDRHGGIVYKKSLESALATPVLWYAMGVTDDKLPDTDHAIDVVRRRLSLPNIVHMIITGQTNIRPLEAFYVWKQVQHIGADALTMHDFQYGRVSSDVLMPDETIANRFDRAKYDALVGNTLEDTTFRQEGMRIALYNTTGTPGIGQKIARLIEHLGGFVVFVGNEDVEIQGNCEVTGEKPMLSSRTVQFFRSFYGCRIREEQEGNGRADIIVRLGRGIEH